MVLHPLIYASKALGMSIKSKFLASCEAFITEQGITATEFGTAALNNRNLMTRLRRGDGITMDKADEVYAYMAKIRANQKRRASRASKKGDA